MSEENFEENFEESVNPIVKRMEAMMMIIDTSLNSLDEPADQLMLACAMMQRTREIFDELLGEEARKKMFTSLT